MRVTSKGQVTIPKHIREKLSLEPGDEVGFREEGQSIIVENVETVDRDARAARFDSWLLEFRRKHVVVDDPAKSVDDIMNELRGYDEDANDPGFKRTP